MSDIIIATAENEKKNLLSLKYNNNVEVVPNGIVTDGIKCKSSWEEKKQILFLALYRKNKGIDLLMQSVSKIKDKLKGWKVVIAGIESDYTIEELKQMAIENNIQDIIEVTGPLFGNDKWDAYRNSDVFVFPTLNENFGIVIAESYLCGTPVITTKGAPWNLIEEYKCGWWIDRTIDKIVSSIEEFIKTSIKTRKNMGLIGRKLVIENYDSRIIAQRMLYIYNKLKK